jgi:hypothetical protein
VTGSPLAALRDLERRYDGPIPARLLEAALAGGHRADQDRCRAQAAIALLEHHMATHHAMTAGDRRRYRRWLRQWRAFRDSLPAVQSDKPAR